MHREVRVVVVAVVRVPELVIPCVKPKEIFTWTATSVQKRSKGYAKLEKPIQNQRKLKQNVCFDTKTKERLCKTKETYTKPKKTTAKHRFSQK